MSCTIVNCEYCNKEIKRSSYFIKRNKHHFCSNECRIASRICVCSGEKNGNWKGDIKLKCSQCGEEYNIKRSQKLKEYDNSFCSKECFGKWTSEQRTGEKHWNWKGGLRPLTKQVRDLYEHHQWYKKILKRDNDTCQECTSTENVQVHHIIELSKLIKDNKIETIEEALKCEALFNEDNGVALCIQCHAEKHPRQKKLILKRAS